MNEKYEEWIEQLKNGEITEEQLFKLMTDDKGFFRLKRGKITKSGKDKKKLYFGGTIIGYKEEIRAPFNFLPGSHEEATPHFEGIPYLLFHNDDMIPIGKVSEAWFDDQEIKYTAWSHDDRYNTAIEEDMMDSQSMGFDPIKYEFNLDNWEYDIETYRPTEMSGVVFPAYAGAKTEVVGESEEEVKGMMTEPTQLNKTTSANTGYAPDQLTANDKYVNTTTSDGTSDWNLTASVPEGEDAEMEKLKKENKILKFLAKHPKMSNREFILKMMDKYNLEEEDATNLIVEEEEVIEEIVEAIPEEPQKERNPPLPKQNEPIPTEDKDREAVLEDLDARIEDSRKRGFGITK